MILMRQRGYNLVEIAIVLTIVMMISSLLAVKYYQVQQEEHNADTVRVIGVINEAIIDYAANHVTDRRILVNTAATLSVQVMIPPGRPYLPCPDVTGDGLEDRRAFPPGPLLTVDVATDFYSVEQGGDCYSNKGIVPWKTLNTPPTDQWGNRYTYRVDNDLSNALYGFDETSRSDQSSLLRALTVLFDGSGSPVAAERQVTPLGAVVIRGVVGSWPAPGIMNILDPSVICEKAPCPGDPVSPLVVGDVVISQASITIGSDVDWNGGEVRYGLESGQIATGVPVVVLSHGKNGNGAIRGDIKDSFICNPIPTNNIDEAQNAFWLSDVDNSTDNYKCVDNSSISGGAQNGFVYHPRSEGQDIQDFDDIVGWITIGDLNVGLHRRNAFPVPQLLPPVGLEDY